MSLFARFEGDSWFMGIWRMDETLDELQVALSSVVLWEEALSRFSSLQRRQEWLSVRLLLRHLLQEDKQICYLPSGKPRLADDSRCISISHTKGYVAVIVGRREVGIDIERYAMRVHKVVSRFMRPDEIVSAYRNDETWSMLLHWSAKEVMFKCLDAEGVDFCRHLHIRPFVVQEQGRMEACEYRTGQRRLFSIDYRIYPDFVLTWQAD